MSSDLEKRIKALEDERDVLSALFEYFQGLRPAETRKHLIGQHDITGLVSQGLLHCRGSFHSLPIG